MNAQQLCNNHAAFTRESTKISRDHSTQHAFSGTGEDTDQFVNVCDSGKKNKNTLRTKVVASLRRIRTKAPTALNRSFAFFHRQQKKFLRQKDPWQKLCRDYPDFMEDLKNLGPEQHEVVEVEACSDLATETFVTGTKVANYSLQEQLGSGGFGQVFLGQSMDSRQEVAIKALRKDSRITSKGALWALGALENADMEIGLLRNHGHHPNIVGFHDAIHTRRNVYLILERAEMDLSSLIEKNLKPYSMYEKSLNSDAMKQVMMGILNGVRYIHSKGIYHLDLKPSNILIAGSALTGGSIEASSIRLCDFGLSRVSTKYDPNSPASRHSLRLPPGFRGGTPGYIAPELVLGKGGEAEAADMWSLGCILLKMYRGRLPPEFHDRTCGYKTSLKTFIQVEKFILEGEKHEGYRLLYDFLYCHLLTMDTEERITAVKATKHPWFQFDHSTGNTEDIDRLLEMIQKMRRGVVKN